ncbi:MAG: cobalamin biosynthesis protein P47K [Planctomycetaceae bacterium]|jgi:G3E family GTPase|nr:cobalamin biosynthesis protein P47K [Planctomycetaceae bacterium]
MIKLILVGGFLGSGKTTLLAEAAQKLATENRSVGLITNDQAPELVDTRLLSHVGKGVLEVAGSCFCCNFDGFANAVQSLIDQGAETIIAEPVGSCTDLSATILNPVKKFHPDWNLAPLTVLVDPNRFFEIIGVTPSQVDPDALYIMKLQMDEADRILINKSDTLSVTERTKILDSLKKEFPDKSTGLISAKTGEGLDAWLKEIQTAKDVGTKIVPVDYDRYAHGEAVLGWLNATASVHAKTSQINGYTLLKTLLEYFQKEIQKSRSEVGHVKAILNIGGKENVANLTSLHGKVDVRDVETKSDKPVLIFNARVQMPPELLEKLVRNLLAGSIAQQLEVKIETLRCLMPGRPNPTHRFDKIEN